MRVLVTGGDGAMGKALRAFLPDATYLSHSHLDVTDADSVWRTLHEMDPNIVIHAAAITDHQCPDFGKLINTNILGTHNVASHCKWYCKLVYLSTHYVYPGERGDYKETDEIRPIGSYAWTKWAGERIVAAIPNHLIIRGSWYTDAKLKLWGAQGALADVICNRVHVEVAAMMITRLVNAGAWGVVNIGGKKRTFVEILQAHRRAIRVVDRHRLNDDLPYEFPRDSSVDTTKYDGLVSSGT